MAKRLQYRKLLLLAVLLGLAFTGLGYRLVDLQVLRHDELSAKAQQNTQREFLLQPRRGDILDINRNLLATSVFVKTVCADPTLVTGQEAAVAHVLAPLLGCREGDLCERLLQRTRLNDKGEVITNRYVVLQHKVPFETWQKVQAAMSAFNPGVDEKKLTRAERKFFDNLRQGAIFADSTDDQLRMYPQQALACHVLGYVGLTETNLNNRRFLQTSGMDGIELALNEQLAGVPGWRLTGTDGRRREVVALREQDVEARNGLNVVLTIDSVVQHFLETALAEAMEVNKPLSITGIAIRPRTGEILAMATLPNFDPNSPGASPADARRDRVISDIVEPGSTFKIVVVAGALNDRTVRLEDEFDCEHGHFAFAGHTLHDHEPFGILSVKSIITKSSNIGAAKIGIRMGDDRLYNYVESFGFGERTGLPLPGELSGKPFVHPVSKWTKVSVAQIPMGQGVGVTRLQMAMAMCALANDGVLMRPMIVDRLTDDNGATVVKYSPQAVRQVVAPATAKLMVEALKTVPTKDGTAPEAALAHYTVAGKTGTAQKVGPGGYAHDKFISSFIGFFPADDPQICISIVMDESKNGYYGGRVAAPVFHKIAEQAANYLNIKPDKDDDSTASKTLVQDQGGHGNKAAGSHMQ
jgi:cell division protein FtsI/penicillin-binding protein 2